MLAGHLDPHVVALVLTVRVDRLDEAAEAREANDAAVLPGDADSCALGVRDEVAAVLVAPADALPLEGPLRRADGPVPALIGAGDRRGGERGDQHRNDE